MAINFLSKEKRWPTFQTKPYMNFESESLKMRPLVKPKFVYGQKPIWDHSFSSNAKCSEKLFIIHLIHACADLHSKLLPNKI